MTDVDTFRQLVASNPATRAKWITISDDILATVEKEYGVTLDREQLLNSSAVKLNVLADAGMDWHKDIEALPEVMQALESKRLTAALNERDDPRHEQAVSEVYSLKPEERLAAVRAMNASPGRKPGSATKRALTLEQKAELIRKLDRYPRSMRIAKAREWGLE